MIGIWQRVIAVALVAGTLVVSPAAQARPVSGVSCPTGSAQVVLDPGHGGADTGAVNQQYGLLEKNLTLAIASRTADLLQAAGYTVALTTELAMFRSATASAARLPTLVVRWSSSRFISMAPLTRVWTTPKPFGKEAQGPCLQPDNE